ncbi:hypothetical protein [Micromonospora endolithica]|uniref:DUF3558 domain-containing protein n=1 Tax=Micromonospora endolithica TaxID=230091 RepID=A0A3A9ZRH3_9ACTN|nr:hypothetical protein [Micromonospora endolithica]RKN50878.1 hypothetical protein D7223_03785 [Micromonospora endolithica]TWJ20353.1 Protein of unknown function (DUF3558) [Micromonospora endolithica]
MRPVARRAAYPLVALLLVTLAGCGRTEPDRSAAPLPTEGTAGVPDAVPPDPVDTGEAPEAAVSPDLDPCAVVTEAEAERLAGTPLDGPRTAPSACTYTGPAGGPTAQVEVYLGAGAKKQLDIERELGHELRTLAGVGDEAYLWPDGAMVFVNRAGRWVSVRLVTLDDPARHRTSLTDLAATVAGRI